MTQHGPYRVRLVRGVVSTDDILPARYKHQLTDPRDLAAHVFEAVRPGFAATIRPGDALVCDDVLGVGSSREQAVSSLKAAGIAMLVAPAFGRIFYRNCWNLALPALELQLSEAKEHSLLTCSLAEGWLSIHDQRSAEDELLKQSRFPPIPAEMLHLLAAGGLLAMLRQGKSLLENAGADYGDSQRYH